MLENEKAPVRDFSKLDLSSEPAGKGACEKCGHEADLHSYAITNRLTGQSSKIEGRYCSVECMMAEWE